MINMMTTKVIEGGREMMQTVRNENAIKVGAGMECDAIKLTDLAVRLAEAKSDSDIPAIVNSIKVVMVDLIRDTAAADALLSGKNDAAAAATDYGDGIPTLHVGGGPIPLEV